MKKIIIAIPLIILASLSILIISANSEDEAHTEEVYASEVVGKSEVTEEDREEYRWNNYGNPKSKWYQVEGAEVNFEEFIEMVNKSLDDDHKIIYRLSAVVSYINYFEDEIKDLGMTQEFDSLQKSSFSISSPHADELEDVEGDSFIIEIEKQLNEINEQLKYVK